MTPTKVLVASRERLFAQALARALGTIQDIEVLDPTPQSGLEAVEAIVSHRPGVAILDYWLDGMEAPAVTAVLRMRAPETKSLVLFWFHGTREVKDAVAAGAAGLVAKNASVQDLAHYSRRLDAGSEPVCSGELVDLVSAAMEESQPRDAWRRIAALTPREVEVLQLLATGLKLDEIAQRLAIARTTARTHLYNILSKLDTRTQMEAIALARDYGLVGSMVHRQKQASDVIDQTAGQPQDSFGTLPAKQEDHHTATTVLVADAQPLFADALAIALDRDAGVRVLPDRPHTTRDALEVVALKDPDVVVLDYWVTSESTIETMLELNPRTRIIVLSWCPSTDQIQGALVAGAAGFLSKGIPFTQAQGAVRHAHLGEPLVYGEDLANLFDRLSRRFDDTEEAWSAFKSLTPRETEVLSALGGGSSIDEVARSLALKKATVNVHIRSILGKTGLRSHAEAVVMAELLGAHNWISMSPGARRNTPPGEDGG